MQTYERMENHRDTGLHEFWHWLYHPANLGRMTEYRARFPLLHRIHLIPARWINAACSRYEWRQLVYAVTSEPPVTFTSPPKMPEAELEDLRRRAHP